MDTRIIVGLAVGVVAALLLVVGVWFVYRRRQRSRNGFHLGGADLDPHSIGLERGIAPPHDLEPQHRPSCSDVSSSCRLGPELSDGQKPKHHGGTGDPKDHLSTGASHSSLPHLSLAVFVCVPKQRGSSRFFLDKENLLSPDGNYTYSLFFNYKFKSVDAHCATIQRNDGEISIDGIIYDEDIDAETLEMIKSVSVPTRIIPKLKQLPDNQNPTSGIIPQTIAMIFEERQKSESKTSAIANPT